MKNKMKMWCLVNKNSNKVVKVGVDGDFDSIFVIGFERKQDLLAMLDNIVDHDEEVKRVAFTL